MATKVWSALSGVLVTMLAGPGVVHASGTSASTASPARMQASVVRADIHIRGVILPASSQQLVSYSTRERRNNEYHIHFKSWWARMLMHNAHVSDLFQLDKNAAYKVFYDSHKYYQCTVADCPTLFSLIKRLSRSGEDSKSDSKTYHPQGTEQCPLHPVRHDVVVKATGKHKTISGYPTSEYRATFTAVYADAAQRKDTNSLQIEFWTTPSTGAIGKIQDIHRALVKRYLSEQDVKSDPLARFLPKDVFKALDAFSGDTSSKDYQWHNSVTRKLARIKGYPVRMQLDWYVHADACPAKSNESDDQDHGGGFHNPFGKLKSMVGHVIKKHVEHDIEDHFRPDPNTPVFHWDRTITSAGMEAVSPDVFEVPAGFKREPMPGQEHP
jgi:hypothetical protein